MSDYPEVIADTPPELPHLLEVPWLLRQLTHESYPWYDLDQDRLAAAFGGVVPHKRVARRWADYLCHCPKALFKGGPLKYRYLGNAPCRVNDAVADEQGLPVGRRLVQPGEVIAFQGWKYSHHNEWERVEDESDAEA